MTIFTAPDLAGRLLGGFKSTVGDILLSRQSVVFRHIKRLSYGHIYYHRRRRGGLTGGFFAIQMVRIILVNL